MAECHATPPPLNRINADRAVACYLYKEAEPVGGKAMAELLAA
jgi:hypothetical protein